MPTALEPETPMSPLRSRFAPLLACLAILGCDHSDPFPTGPSTGGGPFDQIEPIRLTFSTGDDAWPVFSADGGWISYRFARGSHDRDFCAGLLPAGGGQRFEEICAWEADEATRSDDVRSLVLVGQAGMAFTRHASGTGNQAPQEAGLYLAPLGVERDARKVLELFTRPTGASDTWAYLIDPVQTGDNELTVLASNAFIGQVIAFGPVDTIYQGVELARIDLATTPATVTSIAPAPDAVAWARDAADGTLYYHRRYYSAPPGSGPSSVVADTIFRVPAGGGAAESIYGRPAIPGSIAEGLEGFAVAAGAVYLSVFDTRMIAGAAPETRSRILRIGDDGELATISTRVANDGSRWTRLGGSSSGGELVAGSILGGQRDLYLFKVAP